MYGCSEAEKKKEVRKNLYNKFNDIDTLRKCKKMVFRGPRDEAEGFLSFDSGCFERVELRVLWKSSSMKL